MDTPSAPATRDRGRHLLIPAFAPLYARLEPLCYATMRLTSGLIMATFGWTKLFANGMARDIELFHQLGLEPAVPLAYFTSGLEFFGGLAVALGLLTRFFAAMLLGELIVIVLLVMIPRGTGYQLSVVWLGVFLLILAHGGGRISLDRAIGREL